jgi:D-alanine-D-alanine ligase
MESNALHVMVVMGGQSGEREVSLATGRNIARELASRHRVKPVEILATGLWRASPGFIGDGIPLDPEAWFPREGRRMAEVLPAIIDEGIEAAFNALHGPLGEDGTIQGLFRMFQVPFTGPDVIPAAVTMDKRLTKLAFLAAGIRTPRFFSLGFSSLRDPSFSWESVVERESGRIPFPWVLKPNRLGSSVGVSIFESPAQLARHAPDLIARWPASSRGDDVLVEEAVTGRELTCGVIETRGKPVALPPIEIRPRGGRFFDYHAKYTPGASEEICPAPLGDAERELVQDAALRSHSLFECAPLSRTDMFLGPDGTVQVLEINTLPGMTQTSLIPLSASRAGISLGQLFEEILEHAMRRAEGWGEPVLEPARASSS